MDYSGIGSAGTVESATDSPRRGDRDRHRVRDRNRQRDRDRGRGRGGERGRSHDRAGSRSDDPSQAAIKDSLNNTSKSVRSDRSDRSKRFKNSDEKGRAARDEGGRVAADRDHSTELGASGAGKKVNEGGEDFDNRNEEIDNGVNPHRHLSPERGSPESTSPESKKRISSVGSAAIRLSSLKTFGSNDAKMRRNSAFAQHAVGTSYASNFCVAVSYNFILKRHPSDNITKGALFAKTPITPCYSDCTKSQLPVLPRATQGEVGP